MTEITINLHDIPCGNCTVCIGRTIGAKHEQERIIKLLEEQDWLPSIKKHMEPVKLSIDDLIALIKGEK